MLSSAHPQKNILKVYKDHIHTQKEKKKKKEYSQCEGNCVLTFKKIIDLIPVIIFMILSKGGS